MAEGIVCTPEAGQRPAGSRLWAGVTAAALYAALFGCLCDMAALSTAGAVALIPGGAAAVVLALLPRRRAAGLAALGALIAAAVVVALTWPSALDGAKLVLNRLFAASEAKQTYTYEKFSLSAQADAWPSLFRAVLLPLGLGAAAVLGPVCRRARMAAAAGCLLALAGAVSYLGVSPSVPWLLALAGAAAAALWTPCAAPLLALRSALGAGLALALVCGAVLLWLPGEDLRLSAWEEDARDRLAAVTVAYADRSQAENTPEEDPAQADRAFEQEEDAAADLGGDEQDWTRPLSIAAVILALAMLLFVPAVLSDRLKKRRARNRAGLDDPDHAAAIRAAFLYALRWLRLGGLEAANTPFSGYAPQVEDRFSPAVRASYEAVLPLWQEAAYSGHHMDGGQRRQMADFLDETQQLVWAALPRRKRLLARYVYAL
jgi:hypothetical protein